METLLKAVSETLQYSGVILKNSNGLSIIKGKTYAVIGENGAGKTILGKIIEKGWNISANIIQGNKESLKIKSIEFSDIHSLAGCKNSYYQQRWESSANDDMPTVKDLITGKITDDLWEYLSNKLSLYDILNKKINFLSSGELRKFLLINLFSEKPDILIIDNPYIGLDSNSRELFNTLVSSLSGAGVTVILLLCNPQDIPSYADYIIPVKDREILPQIDCSGISDAALLTEKLTELFTFRDNLHLLPPKQKITTGYDTVFEMKDCVVKYGPNIILKNVSWKVKANEHWALLGENGSGKSTLLSLIYADNPQGYSNNITIFDRRRGTGESIWEIKRRIGYISPEMHLYFKNGEDTLTVVASGLHDNIGCYRKITEAQTGIATKWMKAMGLEHLIGRRFNTLSSGEQRLVLLARTFIKNPALLILDEPLHGLDIANKKMVAGIISHLTGQEGVSMVYVTHYAGEIPGSVTRQMKLTKQRNTK